MSLQPGVLITITTLRRNKSDVGKTKLTCETGAESYLSMSFQVDFEWVPGHSVC